MHSYQRLTSLSKTLSKVCLVLFVLLPFYLAHHWLLPTHLWIDYMPFGSASSQFDSWPPPVTKQILGLFITLIPGFFFAKGLWHLRHLFKSYSQGEFFSEAVVEIYSKCASAALWFVLCWILSETLLSVAMSYDSEAPFISVTFTHAHALALFVATLMRVITLIMSASQELAAENQSFV